MREIVASCAEMDLAYPSHIKNIGISIDKEMKDSRDLKSINEERERGERNKEKNDPFTFIQAGEGSSWRDYAYYCASRP